MSFLVLHRFGQKKEFSSAAVEDAVKASMRLDHLDGEGQIFVAMGALSWTEARETILDLFQKAHHPDRVFVGLVLSNVSQVQAESQLQSMPHGGQVRVRAESPVFGAPMARAVAMHKLHWKEPYVLAAHAHVRFYKDWDSALVASLHRAYQKGCHAVTQLPDFVSAGAEEAALSDSGPPTFPVMDAAASAKFRIPCFAPMAFQARHPDQYYHPFLFGHCLFMESDLARELFFSSIVPVAAPQEDSLVLSAVAKNLGVRPCTTTTGILVHLQSNKRLRSYEDCDEEQMVRHKEKIINNVMGFASRPLEQEHWNNTLLKDHFNTDEDVEHMALGLSIKDATEEEIIDKYGSILRFRNVTLGRAPVSPSH